MNRETQLQQAFQISSRAINNLLTRSGDNVDFGNVLRIGLLAIELDADSFAAKVGAEPDWIRSWISGATSPKRAIQMRCISYINRNTEKLLKQIKRISDTKDKCQPTTAHT